MSLFSLFSSGASMDAGIEQFHQTPGAVLLDVRTPAEYEQGHIPGSVSLPLDSLSQISLPTSTPLFVYCLSGSRSASACAWLKRKGYNAVNIGGINRYHGRIETS